MDLREYHHAALRTAKMFATQAENLNHAALGLVTECFEVESAKSLHHISEELADVMWYVVLAAATFKMNVADLIHPEFETTQQWLDSGPEFNVQHKKALGAFVTFVKRVHVYGKTPTPEMLADAVNDLRTLARWVAVLARIHGLDFELVLDNNIKKLRKRYPEAYSDAAAEARADKGGLDARVS